MSIFAKATKSRESKKGFTLVELIVVLVILALLASIMVPTLLGWIDKAKKQQSITNATAVLTAAQALLAEAYAEGYVGSDRDKILSHKNVQELVSFPSSFKWGAGVYTKTYNASKTSYQITSFIFDDDTNNKKLYWTASSNEWLFEMPEGFAQGEAFIAVHNH